MPRSCEAREALDVHLQQISGARPLKTPHLLSRPFRQARESSPGQAARDGGVRHPELGGDQPRTPARALASLTHSIMHLLAAASRLPVWHRRTILCPGTREPLLLARTAIALNPILHRGDRHTPPRRGLAAGHPLTQALLDQLDALPAGQPPTLVQHPGPPRRGSLEGPTASAVTRMPTQPFGTSLGTTTSPRRGSPDARLAVGEVRCAPRPRMRRPRSAGTLRPTWAVRGAALDRAVGYKLGPGTYGDATRRQDTARNSA